MITMHSVDYSNIPHCGSLPRVVVVVVYKEMSVATVRPVVRGGSAGSVDPVKFQVPGQ